MFGLNYLVASVGCDPPAMLLVLELLGCGLSAMLMVFGLVFVQSSMGEQDDYP